MTSGTTNTTTSTYDSTVLHLRDTQGPEGLNDEGGALDSSQGREENSESGGLSTLFPVSPVGK